ncbi:hypothetical protein ORD22_07905 [Sporosarcina sp. GW1-11]|uniref:hypothetical protein n=1 Tax=Sporosarcina sp. GW1-11 TaxID=2899126 RepID=UPI00294D0D9C|nr:hypothetical protein [Sporosarcina sp. GW1-11]MDV6378171.1 hypothetical protein [Sporosarcina sp. GW1-11]
MSDNSNQNNPPNETQIAKLALLGESISLFGQAITTLAAYLALEAEEEEENTNTQMQAQIDYLLSEMDQLKK